MKKSSKVGYGKEGKSVSIHGRRPTGFRVTQSTAAVWKELINLVVCLVDRTDSNKALSPEPF